MHYTLGMRVIIVGAGFTGTQLARYLVQEKHDVSLIESNEERARHASNRIDCLVLHGEGNSLKSLEEAGIAGADALVCVTDSDELNMIICGLAASRFHELVKIARVRNEDYIKVLGIDRFVHPDIEAARAVLTALSHGAQGNILRIPGTPYELGSVTINKGSVFDGLSITDFHTFVREEGIITLVERGRECFLPSGSTTLCPGDLIHILTREEDMDQVFRLAGRTETPLRRIGIVGGGRLGSFIAEGLLSPEGGKINADKPAKGGAASFFSVFKPKSNRRLVIIERDYRICKDLAARFPEALVLNEDVSDESFVAEERIGALDLVITATENQELNIIAAIYLKSCGVRRAIALVSGPGYKTIALQLGVDVAISMSFVEVDSILSHLMGGGRGSIHSLGDGSVGIIELEIGGNSHAAEKSVREFKLSSGGLVMLANRGGSSFIPQGDYVFKAADKVILIARNGSEEEIEKFFGLASKETLQA
ncbi:MAG: NAD-binding protein [Treponema sp.]|nr:NAD-binding protein [Treponema sp.]